MFPPPSAEWTTVLRSVPIVYSRERRKDPCEPRGSRVRSGRALPSGTPVNRLCASMFLGFMETGAIMSSSATAHAKTTTGG